MHQHVFVVSRDATSGQAGSRCRRRSRTAVVLSCLAIMGINGAAQAAETTYGLRIICGGDPGWGVGIIGTSTGGGKVALQSAVQFAPDSLGAPTVTITDDDANPIIIDGVVLQLVASGRVASMAEARYGKISEEHVWLGYVSNVLVSQDADSVAFTVHYGWPDTVPADGAVLFTDDGHDRYGSQVLDGFRLVGCPADLTGDGIVDFGDYLEFLNLFDAQDPRADFDGDGIVAFSDYLDFLNRFDAGC